MTERVARRLCSAALERLRVGQITVVEDGERRVFGSGAPSATVEVHSPRFWLALLHGSRGLAESYADGLWNSPDLTAVVRVAARNIDLIDELRRRAAPVRGPWQRAHGLIARNTPARSRRHVAAHYDLGNELYALMLDKTMSYSCVVFERLEATLEEAAVAKLDLVCEKLDIGPRDHVVEIGSGWGGFAIHAAATRGGRVTTTTLSRERYDVARARVRATGLEDRVTVLLQDYRELHGRYDKLVSIEMIEAVGWRDFGTLFERFSALLVPDGSMLLQAITIDDRAYEVEKASRSFMRTHIFPNGCLPSLEVVARSVARRTDMRMVHLEDLTPHYAETLRRWRANVERESERLAALGYDERMWRMYLSYCEGGFAERRIGVVQSVLAKPRWHGSVAAPAAEAPWPATVAAAG